MKKFSPTVLLLYMLIQNTALASQESSFSYDYVEGGYLNMRLDSSHLDGYLLGVSKSVTENTYLTASYLNTKRETSSKTNKIDGKFFGGGVNYPLVSNADIVVDYSHIKVSSHNEYKNTGSNSARETSINLSSIGVRHQLLDDLEVTAAIKRFDWAGDDILYKGIKIGAIQNIGENLALNFNIAKLKDSSPSTVDWTDIFLGVRYYY